MAAKPHLRAVSANEQPPEPVAPITSVTDAVLRGTPLDVVEQSLLVAARALDDPSTPAVAKAALLNRIEGLQAQRAALMAEARQEADEYAGPAPDEALDPAAV